MSFELSRLQKELADLEPKYLEIKRQYDNLIFKIREEKYNLSLNEPRNWCICHHCMDYFPYKTMKSYKDDFELMVYVCSRCDFARTERFNQKNN